jgi:hypothetical protein
MIQQGDTNSEVAKMTVVLKTPEGKKVVVDIVKDNYLYEAPHNPPNTGTRYTSGTDLYAHKARSGTIYYYSHSWSMWEGTEAEFHLMTDEEMKNALIDRASEAGYGRMSDSEREDIETYFPGIFEEDA